MAPNGIKLGNEKAFLVFSREQIVFWTVFVVRCVWLTHYCSNEWIEGAGRRGGQEEMRDSNKYYLPRHAPSSSPLATEERTVNEVNGETTKAKDE